MSSVKEQIRTEVERLLEFDKNIKTDYYIGKRDAEKEILSFLDTLPEQSLEGLEDEYVRFVRTDHHQLQFLFGKAGIDIARHFAEWGAEHLKK